MVDMGDIDDKELIRRIEVGETGCFDLLLGRYGPQVLSLVSRIVGSREDAEELTQDVFMKAYEKLASYRGDSSFSTWLYRIAYNRAISGTRKRKRETPVGDEIAFKGMHDGEGGYDMEKERRFVAVERALAALPVQDRVIVEMYYYQNKSIDELAGITGMSASNVKMRLFRIRKKIYNDITDGKHGS